MADPTFDFDFSFLDKFDNVPAVTPSKSPRLEDLADGNYDFTIVSATARTTPKSGSHLIEALCHCEQTGQVVPLTWFLDTADNVARFKGALFTLGYDSARWGTPERPLSAEVKKALATMPGRRFKGAKKTNNKAGKTYHNLYVNSGLPPADPSTLAALTTLEATPAAASTAGGGVTDECPF
jgi:hypothetical protein